LTAAENSSASDIGRVIMRDQALTAKIIRLANSPAYFTRTQVKTPTQAVTIIGFEVVRSITVAADLLERAEERGEKTSDLKQLLAKALLSASQALELGTRIQYPEPGSLFTCAMLYSLGDLVLAYHLPDIYQQFDQVRRTAPEQIPEMERMLLGRSIHSLSAEIAKQWHLSDTLVQLLENQSDLRGSPLGTTQEQFKGLVCSANQLSHCLLDYPTIAQTATIETVLTRMSTAFRLPKGTIEKLTVQAFQKASHICQTVKIEEEYFLPKVNTATLFQSPPPHPIFAIFLNPENPEIDLTPPQLPHEPDINLKSSPTTLSQDAYQSPWEFLQAFTLKALTLSNPNTIVKMGLEGLYRSRTFERVVLTMLSSTEDRLETRLSYGEKIKDLHGVFNCSRKDPCFLNAILLKSEPMKLESLEHEWKQHHSFSEFLKHWGTEPCLFGPLWAKNREVGIVIADGGLSGKEIEESDYAFFSMVLSQINANLSRLANKRIVSQ
jgi:HD-like signal output (HDOD) protein